MAIGEVGGGRPRRPCAPQRSGGRRPRVCCLARKDGAAGRGRNPSGDAVAEAVRRAFEARAPPTRSGHERPRGPTELQERNAWPPEPLNCGKVIWHSGRAQHRQRSAPGPAAHPPARETPGRRVFTAAASSLPPCTARRDQRTARPARRRFVPRDHHPLRGCRRFSVGLVLVLSAQSRADRAPIRQGSLSLPTSGHLGVRGAPRFQRLAGIAPFSAPPPRDGRDGVTPRPAPRLARAAGPVGRPPLARPSRSAAAAAAASGRFRLRRRPTDA